MILSNLYGLAFVASLVAAGTFHQPYGHGHKDAPQPNRVIASNYILQFESHLAHSQAHDFLRAHNVQYEVRHDYTAIFHGTAIRLLSDHDGPTLAQIPGIKNVWPTTLHDRPTIISSVAPSLASPSQNKRRRALPGDNKDNDNNNATPYTLHHMTGVNILQDQLKLTGKGIKVAIVDSGVDYRHPAFALPGATEGCFGISPDGTPCRVAFGYDFAGDDYNGQSEAVGDSDPMDCGGHGTHVAGIVGADARNLPAGAKPHPSRPFVGVAPEVTLGAYRVFGCKGGADNAVILAGIHKAVEDKMDIINLSLGGGSAFKTNPLSLASEDAAAKGSLVVGAAGNDGDEGVWMVADVALGDNSLSVASFDNVYAYYPSFSIGGKKYPYLVSGIPGAPLQFQGPTYLYPLVDSKGEPIDECDGTPYENMKARQGDNFVIVANRVPKNCTLAEWKAIVTAHGAVAVLFPLDVEDLEYPDEFASNDTFRLGVTRKSAFKEILADNKLEAISQIPISWSANDEAFLSPDSGAPSGFSSLGLDGDLRSKPDVSGPGGKILSTYPLALGGYRVISGTSMATPYVAGSYALYIQNKNYAKISSADIRQVFKNTAAIYSRPGSKASAVSSVKQGSGLINALRAISTTTIITPDHIDLLDTANFRSKFTIAITNQGTATESYRLSHLPAEALNSYPTGNTFPLTKPLVQKHTAKVRFSGSGVIQVGAGQTINVELNFEEPASADPSQFVLYSGYIIATPTINKNGVIVHVPYTGMRGLAAQVPIFDTASNFPRIVGINTTDSSPVELTPDANNSYIFNDKTIVPSIVLRLGSHSPMVRIFVYSSTDSSAPLGILSDGKGPFLKEMGRVKDLDEKGEKNGMASLWSGLIYPINADTDLTAFANDQSLIQPIQLPAGSYRILVSAQRKLTTGAKKEDFEDRDVGIITLV